MISVAIVTVSDSAFAGTKKDVSGPALLHRCQELNWRVLTEVAVPDEEDAIAQAVRRCVDDLSANVVLTTGGTGIARRDVTPEATRSVLDREISGLAELIRARGLEQTKYSPLSRAVVGSRGTALIVNLPGSPNGALFSLSVIEHLVPHVVDLLTGKTEHASDKMRE